MFHLTHASARFTSTMWSGQVWRGIPGSSATHTQPRSQMAHQRIRLRRRHPMPGAAVSVPAPVPWRRVANRNGAGVGQVGPARMGRSTRRSSSRRSAVPWQYTQREITTSATHRFRGQGRFLSSRARAVRSGPLRAPVQGWWRRGSDHPQDHRAAAVKASAAFPFSPQVASAAAQCVQHGGALDTLWHFRRRPAQPKTPEPCCSHYRAVGRIRWRH